MSALDRERCDAEDRRYFPTPNSNSKLQAENQMNGGKLVQWRKWKANGVCWGIGKPILVPLTTSLYVPGTLADPENVIVDVGTGFYVEKVGEFYLFAGCKTDLDRVRKTHRSFMKRRSRSWVRV
jgi:hypothetical protein